MKLHIAILLLAAVVFSACKSSSTSPSTTNTGGNGTTSKTAIFTVGGTVDTLAVASITTYGPTTTVVCTPRGTVTAGFSLVNISSAGQYNIGAVAGSGIMMDYTDPSGATYSSVNNTGTQNGIMNIKGISSTTLQATFNDTLTLASGTGNSPQTVIVTNGSINVQ